MFSLVAVRIRASSRDPLGLYIREAVQFPVWTHESVVTRGPRGEWVAFMCVLCPVLLEQIAEARSVGLALGCLPYDTPLPRPGLDCLTTEQMRLPRLDSGLIAGPTTFLRRDRSVRAAGAD